MDHDHPNSLGYWRRNEIAGLRLMLQTCHYPWPDPEYALRFNERAARYRDLTAIESRIRARCARIWAVNPEADPHLKVALSPRFIVR
jgi:hypothetical protein